MAPNDRWSLDFVADQVIDGRRLSAERSGRWSAADRRAVA